MITNEQENNLANANRNVKKAQDKTNPYVVNVKNGRLMPNTPRLRAHKDYRVYPASVEEAKQSTTADRMKWIERSAAMRTSAPRIVNSKAEEDAFDVGTATSDELQVFAMETWGLALDPKQPLKTLRSAVMKKAAEMEALEAAGSAAGTDLS